MTRQSPVKRQVFPQEPDQKFPAPKSVDPSNPEAPNLVPPIKKPKKGKMQ